MTRIIPFLIISMSSFMLQAQDIPAGCPESAFCGPQTGKTRAKWLKMIKQGRTDKIEGFRKKSGIPIGVWSKTIHKNAITWNSPCQSHNTEDHTLYLADIFIKQLSSHKDFIIEKTWKMTSKKRAQQFPIPRGEVPGHIDENKIVLIREEEGTYYGLKISPIGKMKVIKYPKNIPAPQTVKCPPELSSAFNKEFAAMNIYQDHHCKEIWNIKRKKYETMVFGWSCL